MMDNFEWQPQRDTIILPPSTRPSVDFDWAAVSSSWFWSIVCRMCRCVWLRVIFFCAIGHLRLLTRDLALNWNVKKTDHHGNVFDSFGLYCCYFDGHDETSRSIGCVWIAFWPIRERVGPRCERSLLRRIQSIVVVEWRRRRRRRLPVQWSVPHAISGLPQALPDQHRLVWSVHVWRFFNTRPRPKFARF